MHELKITKLKNILTRELIKILLPLMDKKDEKKILYVRKMMIEDRNILLNYYEYNKLEYLYREIKVN